MNNKQSHISDFVKQLAKLAEDQHRINVKDIHEAVGERSFGAFLAIPALIEITPIGGVPGVPTLIAVVIIITAIQMLFGRDHIWLPGFLQRRTITGQKLGSAMKWLKSPARWLDRLFQPRLYWFVGPAGRRVVALLTIFLSLTVPILELVPFASTLPMGAIALMGIGLMARDGLVIVIAASAALIGLFGLTTFFSQTLPSWI